MHPHALQMRKLKQSCQMFCFTLSAWHERYQMSSQCQNKCQYQLCKDLSKGVRLRSPTTKMSEALPGDPGQVLALQVGPSIGPISNHGQF